MKRSAINQAFREASDCFRRHCWVLPPNPHWDITDFGLGDFESHGLVLINLANEPEYCEKLMWAKRGQITPCHAHARKKEDIICRAGELTLELWPSRPNTSDTPRGGLSVPVNGLQCFLESGEKLILHAGSRVTLLPGVWHAFYPESKECIIGEVSTANDDLHDNFFINPDIGRFPGIEEDEHPLIRLLTERT